MMNTPHFIRRIVRTLAAVAVLLVATASLSVAQTGDARFQQGEQAFQEADFDTAITFFTDVAQDSTARSKLREDALKYLGRLYIAKSAYDEARRAVRDLLELEPPLVEMNPDQEPPPLLKIYYEERKQIEGDYQVERADPGLQTMAVMDFTNNSIDDHERFDPMRQGFASMMINYLGGATDLKVVERERLQWLLQEIDLQQSKYVDESTAVRMGKMLGATTVLFGAYTVFRGDIQISARLVKVETGEILLAEQIRGDSDDFFELTEDLSLQVAQATNSTLEETEIGARTETRSLDAQMSYADGLSELDKGNYHAAYEKFEEALEYDPNFERAQKRMNSLRPMIAQAVVETSDGGAIDG
jgi:TolB-like protein